jgi:hypothetical protein
MSFAKAASNWVGQFALPATSFLQAGQWLICSDINVPPSMIKNRISALTVLRDALIAEKSDDEFDDEVVEALAFDSWTSS